MSSSRWAEYTSPERRRLYSLTRGMLNGKCMADNGWSPSRSADRVHDNGTSMRYRQANSEYIHTTHYLDYEMYTQFGMCECAPSITAIDMVGDDVVVVAVQ